jgi:hypothetical protein
VHRKVLPAMLAKQGVAEPTGKQVRNMYGAIQRSLQSHDGRSGDAGWRRDAGEVDYRRQLKAASLLGQAHFAMPPPFQVALGFELAGLDQGGEARGNKLKLLIRVARQRLRDARNDVRHFTPSLLSGGQYQLIKFVWRHGFFLSRSTLATTGI